MKNRGCDVRIVSALEVVQLIFQRFSPYQEVFKLFLILQVIFCILNTFINKLWSSFTKM